MADSQKDYLAIINRVIAEHRAIRERVMVAGGAVNDIEALFTLQKARSVWAQSSVDEVVARQNQLQEAITLLVQNLSKHFGYEEAALPPLFGTLLMNALLFEHQGARQQMEKARQLLADTKLEQLTQRERLLKKTEIQETISSLSQTIEEHAGHEEIILNMMKKAMEAEA